MRRKPIETYEESIVKTRDNFFNLYGKYYRISFSRKHENGQIEEWIWSEGKMSSSKINQLYLFLKTPLHERFTKFRTDAVGLYAASLFGNRTSFVGITDEIKKNPGSYGVNLSFFSYGNGGAIVHHPSGSIFLEIPKCATTSLKNLKGSQFIYINQSDLETKYADYKVYGIIRNPYERVISAYFETKFRHEKTNIWPSQIYSEYPYVYFQNCDLDNFRNFVTILEQNGLDFDAHTQKQSWYMHDSIENRSFRIDELINFNNLQKLESIAGESLGKMNGKATEDQKNQIRQLLVSDQTLRERVAKIYAEDLLLFKQSCI
jgi:hypothetical protein